MVSVIMLVVIGLCTGWIVWIRRRRARVYTAPIAPGGILREADGALEKKLQAYIEVSKLYASVIKDYKGNWVPGVVMGGGNGTHTAGFGRRSSLTS